MSQVDATIVIAVLVHRLQLLGGKTDVSPFDMLDVAGMAIDIQSNDAGGISITLNKPEPS